MASLRSGERIEVPVGKHFDPEFVESFPIQEPGKPLDERYFRRVLCLTIIYRRDVDKRQFIQLEPMRAIVLPGGLGAGFLRHTDFSGSDPTEGSVTEDQIEQIEKKEKMLFRIQ